MTLVLASGLVTAAPASAAIADPPRVAVVVKGSEVRMPSTLRPGMYRFAIEVRGDPSNGLQLMRPRAGYSAADYTHDIDVAVTGGRRASRRAARRLEENTRPWGGMLVERGRTGVFWQHLPRGRLFAVTQSILPKVHVIKVSGERRRTSVPVATGTVRLADGALGSATVLPHRGTLLVRNRGTLDHAAALVKLAEGKTAEDVVAFFDGLFSGQASPDSTTSPTSPFDEATGNSAAAFLLAPGGRLRMRYSLPRGTYVVLCSDWDRAAHEFHVQQGEIATVSLT